MKNIALILFLSFNLLNASVSEKSKNSITEINFNNSQEKEYFGEIISDAIKEMRQFKNSKKLDSIFNSIEDDKKMTQNDKTYWQSYILYSKSLFYSTVMRNTKKASENIDLAIEKIEENPTTSEDYALLAVCKSFSIQFASAISMGKLAGEVKEYGNKSLEINDKNLRAYYALAINNFYTPKMFGGMKKVEEYAKKGLACPYSLSDSYYVPYWGKPQLYWIYIKFLEKENRTEDAKKYKSLAKKDFPNYSF